MGSYNENYGTLIYGPGSINDNFRRLKYYVGDYVPEHSINIGYMDVPRVSASDSVRVINQIGTNITSIPSNKKVINLNTNGTVPVFTGPSDYCVVTDKFYLNETDISSDRNRILNALWYRYKLRSYVKCSSGLSKGYTENAGIYVTIGDVILKDSNLLYRITIDNVVDADKGIYECSVWTNFQKGGYTVRYTPVSGKLGHSESLNPIPAFKQYNSSSVELYEAEALSGYAKYSITVSGTFDNPIAVWWPDAHQLKIMMPPYSNYKDNWYLKIGRGQFIGKCNGVSRVYRNDNYYNQNFYNGVIPVIKIKNDKCDIVSSNSVKLGMSPVIASFDSMNLYVKLNVDGVIYTTKPKASEDFSVANINSSTGVVSISDDVITETSTVIAEYFIWEIYSTYRGYRNTFGRFTHVDFNTNYGHYITLNPQMGTHIESNKLIYYTASIWMNPVKTDGSLSDCCMYHNFNPNSGISTGVYYAQSETVQIGTVNITHHDGNCNFLDGRSRGGGLKESLVPNKDSDIFWDIGYWEGSPYQSNGVFLVDLNNSPMEKEKVEFVIDKYKALGTLGLVRIGPRRDIDGTEIDYTADKTEEYGFSVSGASMMSWQEEEEE
jgi:hypothetical protein